ncbi:hypothetical protein [Bacillus safensis]|uniref:hypothetical protein n=1 Tax=Bacillus safensis TaxID=561879 RepID=UPI0021E59BD9|nr:hypothetical protein [Bacillus safensis]UXO88839.1 hypothetical protein N7921_03800 [Bacillus safensis]
MNLSNIKVDGLEGKLRIFWETTLGHGDNVEKNHFFRSYTILPELSDKELYEKLVSLHGETKQIYINGEYRTCKITGVSPLTINEILK